MTTVEKNIYKEIGRKLQKIRKETKLNQEDLATQIGVSRSFIASIESQGVRISAVRIKQILDALGYDWDFTEKKTIHAINIPDEEYQKIQILIQKPETDPQGDELRTRLKRFFFPS